MAGQQDKPSKMRAYLLGRLEESAAVALDAECLDNQDCRLDFWEAEALLIEDYVLDRLSQADRRSFEQNYMVNLRNQEHVALIAGLAGARSRVAFPTPRPQATWRIAVAAMLAVGLGLGSWQVWNSRQLEHKSLLLSQQLADTKSGLFVVEAKLSASEINRTAVFRLDETLTREGYVAPIVVPSGATELTLVIPRDLALPDPRNASLYREGVSSRELVGTPRIVVPQRRPYALVYVDARLLKSGSYQLELEGQRSLSFKIA